MFELIIFEITGTMSYTMRWWNWRFDVYALLLLLLVILPLYIAYAFATLHAKNIESRVALTAVLVGSFWYYFWILGESFPLLTPDGGGASMLLMENLIARVAVIGCTTTFHIAFDVAHLINQS